MVLGELADDGFAAEANGGCVRTKQMRFWEPGPARCSWRCCDVCRWDAARAGARCAGQMWKHILHCGGVFAISIHASSVPGCLEHPRAEGKEEAAVQVYLDYCGSFRRVLFCDLTSLLYRLRILLQKSQDIRRMWR